MAIFDVDSRIIPLFSVFEGIAGSDGKTPYIGDNGNWWIGDYDTEKPFSIQYVRINGSDIPVVDGKIDLGDIKYIKGNSAISLQKYTSPFYESYRDGQEYNATFKVEVFYGMENVTSKLNSYNYKWERISENSIADPLWNELHTNIGNELKITETDIGGDTCFVCSLLDNSKNIISKIIF